VSEDELAAELQAAQANVKAVGWSDIKASQAAYERVLAAERGLASARGEPYAQTLDLGFQWDTGAPLPHLLSNGRRALVVFYLSKPDPAWDGTYATVVDPASGRPESLGVVDFVGVSSVRMGAPNDEALNGHPLYGRGLRVYSAHEVQNSLWLDEHIRVNSVHARHSEETWRQQHHYLLAFHDEMVECLARQLDTRTVHAPFRQVLADLAKDLLSPG
jgi:hypothetical protein